MPLGARRTIWVAVDLAVFTVQRARLEILLIQMKRPPFEGRWALPGGRIGADERVEEAAARELTEKTGLDAERAGIFLEQLYTFSAPDRDPAARCVSVAHLALVPPDVEVRHSAKYSGIGWFSADRPPPLAFDHRAVVRYAKSRLRAKLSYANIAYSLLPSRFTLAELQGTYQAILGRALDPRNFRKRIVELGVVADTGELRTGEAHRPGRLFRFTVRRPVEIGPLV